MTRLLQAAVLLVLWPGARGAQLSVDQATVQVGAGADVAVRLASAGGRATALQFDLNFDQSSMGIGARAAVATTNAGKSVYSAVVARGRIRVVVAGLNQTTLDDGPVVTLTVLMASGSAPGVFSLGLSNPAACDSGGNVLPLTATDGSVTVSGTSGDNASPSGIFAHTATGGGWKTSITLLNLSPTASPANLTFWNDDGTPLALPLTFSPELQLGPTVDSSASFVIPANGVALVETDLPQSSKSVPGWARLTAPAGVVGAARFRYHGAAGPDLEAVVPLETRTGASFILPFDNTAGISTGVAVASGSDNSAVNVQVIARNAAGVLLLIDSIALPVRGHTSFMLKSRFPALAGDVGSLEFQAPSGGNFAVLGLRVNQTDSLTSVPAQAK